MSPEQVRGRRADARSDIFSLGATLYEMLTGGRAFQGDSPADTMSAILSADPPDHAGIPRALRRVIDRCLAKDKQERFQSARDLRFALETLSDDTAETEARAVSIAVLPFKDLSPKKDHEYFCDGMAEEIANALIQVPDLRVAAGASALRGGKSRDVREVGGALGVSHLLDGSVRTAGKRLRVTVQLVNAAGGYHVWSERFDREMEDVFAVQDEIASNIVDALRLRFGAREADTTKRHGESLDAYHLYLKGRHAFDRRRAGGPHRAVEYYEQAVAIDPAYALAHAGRGDCYTMLAVYGAIHPRDAYEKIEAAVEQALAVDGELAEAHTTRARFLWMFDGSVDEAEREFLRAIELNPFEVQAWCWYTHLLAAAGRWDEAMAKAEMAIEIDPLSPYTHSQVGIGALFYEGFHGRAPTSAVAALDQAAAMDPNHTVAHYTLGMALGRAGEHERAIEALSRVVELTSRTTYYLAILAWAYGIAGRTDEARSLLAEIHERAENEYVGPMLFAFIHGGLGEKDEAMEWLLRAEKEGSPIRVWLGLPLYDRLRGEPPFDALVARTWNNTH
jgi:serine/threonine-protein kinase